MKGCRIFAVSVFALGNVAYGHERVSSLYPIVFLGYGLAGIIGPAVGGAVQDLTGSYFFAVLLAALVVFVGAGYYYLRVLRAGVAHVETEVDGLPEEALASPALDLENEGVPD